MRNSEHNAHAALAFSAQRITTRPARRIARQPITLRTILRSIFRAAMNATV